jgi:hypothetical protein
LLEPPTIWPLLLMPRTKQVITFEDAKIPDGAADIENGVLLGTVDGADKGIDSDLPRIVDAKGGAETGAVANPNSQIRHWGVPVEKGMESKVNGVGSPDDLPVIVDGMSLAYATARESTQIRHCAVPVEKGVGSGVAGQACITDDLAAVIDSRGAAEVTAEGSQVCDGITALRFVSGHLPGSSAQQQLTNQSRRYYQI